MKVIKEKCPIWNTWTKQIEYREVEFVIEDDLIYFTNSVNTAINCQDYFEEIKQ